MGIVDTVKPQGKLIQSLLHNVIFMFQKGFKAGKYCVTGLYQNGS